MNKDAKRKVLTELEELAEALYRKGSSVSRTEAWERQQGFIAGFCKAGVNLSVATTKEIQQTIDKAHMTIYGEGRAARRERYKPIQDESQGPDWDAFDSPAYERQLKAQKLPQ